MAAYESDEEDEQQESGANRHDREITAAGKQGSVLSLKKVLVGWPRFTYGTLVKLKTERESNCHSTAPAGNAVQAWHRRMCLHVDVQGQNRYVL